MERSAILKEREEARRRVDAALRYREQLRKEPEALLADVALNSRGAYPSLASEAIAVAGCAILEELRGIRRALEKGGLR